MPIHVPPETSVLAMDVHKNTISAAVLEPGWDTPVVDKVTSGEVSVRRLLGRFDLRGAFRHVRHGPGHR